MCETCGCLATVTAASVNDQPIIASAVETPPPAQTAPEPWLERFSDGLQHVVKVSVGANGKPPRLFRSLLNGTWLGHPLHPAITDVPIGAWTIAAIFDIIWLIAPVANVWASHAAFVAVIVGLIGALGAAVTGLTDWSDTYGSERRVGLYHAILNVTATLLYLISFILRLLDSSNENVAAAILGFLGLIAVLSAAFLGGDLVFAKGTGVNHTAWETAGKDFVAVKPLSELEENKLVRVNLSGAPVVLLRQGERIYAISARCTHAGGPLNKGSLTGDVVECPWHGSRFRMSDGQVLTGPATNNAHRYEARVRDGQVELRRVTPATFLSMGNVS